MVSTFEEGKQKRKLENLLQKEEEGSVQILSQKYKIPYADVTLIQPELDALKILTEEKARLAHCAVFQAVGKHIKIAVQTPEKDETKSILKHLDAEGYSYDLFLVSGRGLEKLYSFYQKIKDIRRAEAGAIEVSSEKIAMLERVLRGVEDIKEKIDQTFSGKTTELLEIIIAGSVATDASDIHIEPREENARLRYRLDGVLYDITFLPVKIYTSLLSRIKLVSELKLNIHDRAQDGRFTVRISAGDTEIRTSILPGPYGENVVLRVLNPKSIGVKFEELGMQPWIREHMERELKKPNGMILTTGPTGSGKTTTLYTFLKKIHSPGIKIITLEDPIEYHLSGIEQTQVDEEKGYDFSSGLRAIVRQDPDVILVGEIRDKETAETAMHASLTGHLVFSTLHTNNAAGTIPRLLDLGIKAEGIAPALNIMMAQRLVRKLCMACRISHTLGKKEKEAIQNELKNFPKHIPVPDAQQWKIYTTGGQECEKCNRVGYKGRVGVFEIILVEEGLERVILDHPSESDIKKEALRQGQITMRQDALLKVLLGITDFDEIERVLGS